MLKPCLFVMGGKLMKWLVLVVALVAPVAVILFLHIFGRNEFEVTPLFTDSLPHRPSWCPQDAQVPYVIPRELRPRISLTGNTHLILYCVEEPEALVLQRIEHAFNADELRVAVLSADSIKGTRPNIIYIYMPPDSMSLYYSCYFFLPEQNKMVLVDDSGRIRGYYGSVREDLDKLLMEVTIILKKY